MVLSIPSSFEGSSFLSSKYKQESLIIVKQVFLRKEINHFLILDFRIPVAIYKLYVGTYFSLGRLK